MIRKKQAQPLMRVIDVIVAKPAAQAILKKQKKKVLGLFGNINMSITKKRLDAFAGAFLQPNIKTKLVTDFAFSTDDARNKTIAHLTSKNKPDTVFCMSDEILTGTMKAIQELELKMPKDISIISLSNGIIPKLYYPEITYVETSGYKLGKLAFTRMMGCLSGSTFMQELIVESVLVEGGSL